MIETRFLIIVCTECGRLLIAKNSQKTKTCSYCNSKITVKNTKILSTANTAIEASEILRRLKRESASK